MPRDVVRYILTILVPLRLLLTLPAPPASVTADRLVQETDRNHTGSAPSQARPRIAAEFSQAPASAIAFEAGEFSEEEDDSDFTTIHEVSRFDDRPSAACRLECRSPRGARRPSRTFPLRC